VEFALDMPQAHSVQVAGSFNNWVPQPCELRKDNGSSRWMLTLPLQPGRYEYAFLVDGKHMVHPNAELYQDDGFGNRNAVLALGAGAPPVSVGSDAQQAVFIQAVEDARKVGVPDSTMNRLLRLARGTGVEHASMTNLVHLVGVVKMQSLPMGPFVNKIEEGMAKHASMESIEQVLNQKMEDYRFTQVVTADYLKKHGLRQQVTSEDLAEIAESLYSGLTRQDLSHAIEQSPAVPLSILKRAIHLQASLKQAGFDEKLSDQIVSAGFKYNFLTPQQCGFARTLVAGKRKGIPDARIAGAALSVMQGGGTVTDIRSQIGVSSSDIGQYGL
jgi:predicted DNA binding CopG/RHH family protein